MNPAAILSVISDLVGQIQAQQDQIRELELAGKAEQGLEVDPEAQGQ